MNIFWFLGLACTTRRWRGVGLKEIIHQNSFADIDGSHETFFQFSRVSLNELMRHIFMILLNFKHFFFFENNFKHFLVIINKFFFLLDIFCRESFTLLVKLIKA